MESLNGYEDALDRVFDFRQLLIHAPSGMLIEPPIIKESIDALTVVDNGMEAAVSDRIYNISKNVFTLMPIEFPSTCCFFVSFTSLNI